MYNFRQLNQNQPQIALSWITTLSRRRDLHNSVKLWAMPCRATQDGWVIVESSDKMWSTGGGNGKSPQYSCCESPHKQYEKAKIRHWKMRPQVNMLQYATEKSGEIAPERMKRLTQHKNNAQLLLWLVMEVKFDDVKTILHRTLEY